jgi:hypothetical protein
MLAFCYQTIYIRIFWKEEFTHQGVTFLYLPYIIETNDITGDKNINKHYKKENASPSS